jgi:hypothetical protein
VEKAAERKELVARATDPSAIREFQHWRKVLPRSHELQTARTNVQVKSLQGWKRLAC